MTNKLNSRTDNKGGVVNDNSNSDIVELLAQGLSALERGLQAVKRDVPTPAGNIDILAVDMVGRIVIVEVCDSRSEDILFRAIDHFDWALSEMSALKQKLESYNIDPTLAPRILILAPSFTEKFVKRASYLNPNFIDIYEFQIKESISRAKNYTMGRFFHHLLPQNLQSHNHNLQRIEPLLLLLPVRI